MMGSRKVSGASRQGASVEDAEVDDEDDEEEDEEEDDEEEEDERDVWKASSCFCKIFLCFTLSLLPIKLKIKVFYQRIQ